MVARFTPEKPIVSADWLLSHLTAPDVRVLDCTYFMPGSPRTGRQAYDAHHIPGARFFDIDDAQLIFLGDFDDLIYFLFVSRFF